MADSTPEGRVESVHHPVFARIYLRAVTRRVASGEDEYRRRLLAGLSGHVLELGAGSGINFDFYPPAVEHVLAVEPEPRLRAACEQSAARASVAVTVVAGVSGRLPAPNASMDAAVASLVLCSVPDQPRALAELRRVLAAEGQLRFYEHVAARGTAGLAVQRLADALWPHVAGGCHLSRDTEAAITQAGFTIEHCEHFHFSPGPPMPPIPHILGAARR